MSVHELPLEERTLRGAFSRDHPPVLTIEPGDSVRFQSLNARWHWEHGVDFVETVGPGHALNGPIEVRGALAGETLVVHIDEVTPRDWGVTFGAGQAFVWSLTGDRWTSERGHSVHSAPFLGVIGMPPPEPGLHSTAPPRRWGGNIDCKLLVTGTTLFLPIPLNGARLSAGDGHGAQGDGELSGTAIECPLESAQLTLDVRDDLDLRMPIARTPDAWLTFGFHEHLDVAGELAAETMLDLIVREHDVDRAYALALASVAVDLHVTQVVNGAKGVHAVLRDDAIEFG